MKNIHKTVAIMALLFALTRSAQAAGPFTVNTTSDTHAVTPGSSANDGTGHISIRSAIEAANAQAGPTTINIPPGTYNLTLGELGVAPVGSRTITLQASGGTASNTFINQTDGINRVFDIDSGSVGSAVITITGVTIQGGHDQFDILGGAGILAGSVTATPKDVLSLSGCVIVDNHCSAPNTNYTSQPGGGIQMAGGDLNLSNCIFSNNTSAASQGGAIAFIAPSVTSTLTITGSTFSNNKLTNNSGSGPDGGGAIYINSTAGPAHFIGSSTFTSNSVIGAFGNTFGGAVNLNTGTLNITNSTFTGNAASGQGGQGGAIYVDSGTANISFCRIVGNTASVGGSGVYNHGSNGGNTVAPNNWWGCNGGPGAAGCDAAASNGGTLTTTPFIVLTNSASPSSILPGQSTTLTASFLRNSAGSALTTAQISVLLGLPVTWGNAVLGTLSAQQTTLQANGTATATFTAGSSGGAGSASATVDSGIATAQVTITCPTITGTVAGGGSICVGDSAIVTVTISGGTPPYSVTLNNGGGTQTGNGPFTFSVSPATNTVYQLASGLDSHNCPVTGSGSASVTTNALPAVSIVASPSVVFANSSGNQASAPPGAFSYAWTITNGVITSPANLQTITYISGVSGSVTLRLTAFNASGCSASNAATVRILTGFSVHTNVTFTDALSATTMGMAFDGTNYWSCSGGSAGGVRLARYSGVTGASYSPGLDFRSIFTKADGTIQARAYNDRVIYRQSSPGVFASSGVTLSGGTLDPQSSVVLNGAGTEYNAMVGGIVSRWDTNGNFIGTVTLDGFGALTGENLSPQNRGLAAFGNVWLTYNGGGVLSLWDFSGNRLTQVLLPGAGTSSSSSYSFSFCNGKVFIVDSAGATWRAFDISTGAAVAVLSSETTASWNTDVTNKIAGLGLIPQVDFIPVSAGNPVPTLAQLRAYQSLYVFSDASFNDNVAVGNVLADYIDQGGGVALATFAYWSSGGLSIQGRLATTYLPFTTSSQSASANQTLIKDLATHPLLDGVASFNGGSSGYQNSPISIASGATLVAHWSNGQPLVGAKDVPPGRIAGLNFFPPSSDVRSDLWLASTDGARLMANALLWAGRIPPIIVAAPADSVVAIGSNVFFSVTAVGASPLTYQWRLNGTNIPAATNSTLSFTALTNSMGSYSVAVSNLYGITYSVNASLNPQLRFLPLNLSGGTFPLLLQNSDGSPVASNRAVRVQVSVATVLSPPFTTWLLLTNPVTPSNGLLRVDGLSATNAASRFFRAQEAP